MKPEIFYEVTHKRMGVGFFKTKEAAVRCASEFKNNIGGYDYPVEIVTREFLDFNYVEEDKGDLNWGEWDNGGV